VFNRKLSNRFYRQNVRDLNTMCINCSQRLLSCDTTHCPINLKVKQASDTVFSPSGNYCIRQVCNSMGWNRGAMNEMVRGRTPNTRTSNLMCDVSFYTAKSWISGCNLIIEPYLVNSQWKYNAISSVSFPTWNQDDASQLNLLTAPAERHWQRMSPHPYNHSKQPIRVVKTWPAMH
jgi:hypothetical protein